MFCFHRSYRFETFLRCGCVLEKDDYPGDNKICDTNAETLCSDTIYYTEFLVDKFNGKYDKDCPLECNSLEYELVTFQNAFPSHEYVRKFIQDRNMSTLNVTRTEVARSLAKINVYYGDMSYQIMEEISTYKIMDLFAGVGGMLGLFLGMSILSFIEIIELLLYMFMEIINLRIVPKFDD